jgi:hypothetical protein
VSGKMIVSRSFCCLHNLMGRGDESKERGGEGNGAMVMMFTMRVHAWSVILMLRAHTAL